MKENNLEELIDGFLRNKLTITEHARLQEIIGSDPEADRLLKESQETYRFILHLQYKKIRNQLRAFDQHTAMPYKPARVKRFFIAATLLLLVTLGSYIVAGYTFSPRLVAKRNFKAIPATALSPGISEYVIAAEDFFMNDNFQGAARLYQPTVAMIDDKYAQHVKWNFLLCQLAME